MPLGWGKHLCTEEDVELVPMTLTCKIFFVCKDFSWRLCGDPG
jgi:hypothetical protein